MFERYQHEHEHELAFHRRLNVTTVQCLTPLVYNLIIATGKHVSCLKLIQWAIVWIAYTRSLSVHARSIRRNAGQVCIRIRMSLAISSPVFR